MTDNAKIQKAVSVSGLGGFFIGKAAGKKKKPALAGGTENTDGENT